MKWFRSYEAVRLYYCIFMIGMTLTFLLGPAFIARFTALIALVVFSVKFFCTMDEAQYYTIEDRQ